MNSELRIVIAQINLTVGDIFGNLAKIISYTKLARDEYKADLVVFPELALSGYPPEDLLLRKDFHLAIQSALKKLCAESQNISVIVGYPEQTENALYNAAVYISNGNIVANYRKHCLPNYGVFDEKRYFQKSNYACVIELKNIPIGITICEDLWFSEPATLAIKAGAKLIICINASPFDVNKLESREKTLRLRINEIHVPILYAHCVGGQDEVVFDGRSLVMDQSGKLRVLAPLFEEILIPVDFVLEESKVQVLSESISPYFSKTAKAYQALVTGLRDYVNKNHFPGAIVGLSGGIDSALTLCIAVDALGPDRVEAVLMPSRFTAEMSTHDAILLAENLGIKYRIIPIENSFQVFLETLAPEFSGAPEDVTEQNIQARCRAIILMALSNKFGKLVLTTGNKSEMATGYATLYGDMAGGFAVLKDVYKTLVYELAHYRNHINFVIPQRIIVRPPSAELAENQTDEDTLPPYPVLDEILKRFVEANESVDEIIAAGFDEQLVRRIILLIIKNEYKRRQAPPGTKITTKAFGRDRRYPITAGFRYF